MTITAHTNQSSHSANLLWQHSLAGNFRYLSAPFAMKDFKTPSALNQHSDERRRPPEGLFLNPRNMSGGKLPATIALDQRVRELHDSIERFAVCCSFHARFSENNCRVITVKPR